MSGVTASGASAAPSRGRTRTAAVILGIAVVCCLFAISLAGAVAAQEGNETSDSGAPPAFGNATKGDLTTIQLTITDDTDVDEGSISAEDFSLQPGNLKSVNVTEAGTDANVELSLADVVNQDDVTVSLATGGSIADAAGNRLTDANVTVSGMDGYRPQLQDFTVERLNESAAEVRVVSSEPLSELYVGVGGPGTGTLTMANFTERETPAAFEVPYEATVTFDGEGRYDFVVGTMTDANGVTSRYNVERTFLVDRTPPSATISGPASASVGESVTFSADGSTDEFGVDGYEWAIDGNVTGSGESIEHAFETPGYHAVTVTVRDRRNNTHTRTSPILVESEVTTDAVSVTANGSARASATLGPNRTTGRVLVTQDGGLVATTDVRLESLAVDLPVNESANLTFGATENASTSFDAVNTTALAGLRVDHDRSLPTATFRFSVNRSRLDAAGLSPDDVTLYRNADGWGSVYTMRINESDGWVTYEATAAGLSEFVVGAAGGDTESSDSADGSADTGEVEAGSESAPRSTGSARILVQNSTLLTESVDSGDRAVVRAILHNSGNATGSYRVGMVVNNSGVSSTVVTVPPGENRTVTFAERVEEGGSVVVNGTLAGELSVGGTQRAASAGGGGGLPISIPNPLALWPGGLVGRVLGGVFWFLAISFAVLKALAIYLGY